jgi:hypothetical protein
MQLNAQTEYSNLGKTFRLSSTYSMFPDSLRNEQPRIYQGKIYTATEHYNDSSVFIFIPNHFNSKKEFELVFWFHGWNNNIDSALKTFRLVEQFAAAKRNAIFIFPEGPKNAPDSYAGKFEQPNYFHLFVKDILQKLVAKKEIQSKANPSIILAGHSGAYKVISHVLQYAAYTTKGIVLFDALYGQQKIFADYIEQHANFSFVNIYTNNGGTLQNSIDFMKNLGEKNLSFKSIEQTELTEIDIQSNRLLFIHSNLGHNEVLSKTNYFQLFVQFMK